MKLLAYSRVSTEEQAKDGHSLGQQRQQFDKFCVAYDHQLIDVITDDGVSGSTPLEKRPGGAQLLHRLEQGEADGVIVRDLDRMFRIALDGLMTFAWFDRRGIVVHSINDKIDTESPEGKLTLTIKLATAEYERNKIAQRTRATMQGLKADARVYGHVPYGMQAHDGMLYRDPATWQLREYIYELRDNGMSLRNICKEMQRDRVPAPNGGKLWHASTLINILDSRHDFNHVPELPMGTDTVVSLNFSKEASA